MTLTKNREETSTYIQSLSVAELKAMFANGTPVKMKWADEASPNSEIYAIMDLTDMEYANVECILNEPHKARLCDIQVYCHALNMDVLEFIQKALQQTKE